MDSLNWIEQKGLAFQCTGCGKCCTGAPGSVYLSPEDIATLAAYFSLSEEEFCAKYTQETDGFCVLRDIEGTQDCIFLQDNRCSAYEARPIQCKTFPWWIFNLRSPADWQEAKERCEGIEKEGAPLIAKMEIEAACASHLDNLIAQNFFP